MGDGEDRSQKWWPYVGIPGAIVAIGTIIGALLGVFDTDTDTDTNRGLPTADESVPTSITTIKTITTTTIATTTSTTTPAPIPMYLAEEKLIQEGSGPSTSCGYLSSGKGPLAIDDVLYYRAVGVYMTCPYSGGFAWVDYNVPSSCSRLFGTVGIDDNAPTAAHLTMEVLDALSMRSLYKTEVGPREGRELVDPQDGMEGVSMADVSRVRLQITAPPSRDVHDSFIGVFGDARLLCRQTQVS